MSCYCVFDYPFFNFRTNHQNDMKDVKSKHTAEINEINNKVRSFHLFHFWTTDLPPPLSF